MNRWMPEIASPSTTTTAFAPIRLRFGGARRPPCALRLVEEAAAFEQACAFFGRDLDISRCEQQYLVGDPLHAAVECVREPAREVDQALRELLVRALEVEDDRDRLLELVRDLLRVVEAARQNEVDAHGRPCRLHPSQPGRPNDFRLGGCVVGPLLELSLAAPRRQPPNVRALAVAPLELVVRRVAVLVPVLFLGDSEVDEGAIPDVCKSHGCRMLTAE